MNVPKNQNNNNPIKQKQGRRGKRKLNLLQCKPYLELVAGVIGEPCTPNAPPNAIREMLEAKLPLWWDDRGFRDSHIKIPVTWNDRMLFALASRRIGPRDCLQIIARLQSNNPYSYSDQLASASKEGLGEQIAEFFGGENKT